MKTGTAQALISQFARARFRRVKTALLLQEVPLSMSLKKLLGFFDSDVLQFFEFELRPYQSNDSI